ncbi:DUF5615 family PIN-like protein [Thiothrix lacustris]|uniref:DUF5615 family PIN-like protein n=1 Tax=Thiothrix lacustris TaxID=525917 RepID=UPI003555F25F
MSSIVYSLLGVSGFAGLDQIVTKDADFSDLILLNDPPPRIIHIRTGNMKMREFHQHLNQLWEHVCLLSETYKLVQVYNDRVEGLG